MKKALLTTLLIAGAAAALWVGKGAFYQGDAETVEPDSFKIKLVEESAERLEVAPGEPFSYNIRLKNEGTDPAVVFIRITNPIVAGAELTDGSTDPEFINYEVDDSAWTEVDNGVYSYNDVLEGGGLTKPLFESTSFPEYDFHSENGKVMTGDVTIEDLGSFQIRGQGYAVMTGLKGTRKEMWDAYLKNTEPM